MTNLPIRLRDVSLADADMLDEWASSPEIRGEFNDFGQTPDNRAGRPAR